MGTAHRFSESCSVQHVAAHELKARCGAGPHQELLVPGAEVVIAHHFVSGDEQAVGQIAPDESSTAGDQIAQSALPS